MTDENKGADDAARDRGEVAFRAVWQVPVEARVNDERGVRGNEKSVAVRGSPCRNLGSDVAARAGPVVHDELLLQPLGEALGQQARVQVGAATGRGGHDQPDGTCGPGVLRQSRRRWKREEQSYSNTESLAHAALYKIK
jgi:hypothetical protein